MSTRLFRILSALSSIVGVIMLGVSFSYPGPPLNPTSAQMADFARHHFVSTLSGAWLQATGPLLIVLFAFAVVCLAGATTRLAGWMTFFGGSVLMMVSLTEIVCYFGLLYSNPAETGLISFNLIHAVQHLYYIVAAPALFIPLGIVLLGSRVLPRVFGYLALALGAAFAILGVVFLNSLVLPVAVQAFAAIQALWWLTAAITMIVQAARMPGSVSVNEAVRSTI
jgi:hypothetical protein